MSTHRPPSINDSVLEYLRPHSREETFEPGQVICNRAETPDLHVVLEGEVEVRMQARATPPNATVESGRTPFIRLIRLPVGSTFGEMALIQNRPGSSLVLAVSRCRILTYPGSRFQTALHECPQLRDYLFGRLAFNLQETRGTVWSFFRRTQAFHLLQTSGLKAGPIVAKSRRMQEFVRRLHDLAPLQDPVLVVGEPGTGKFLAACKLLEFRGEPDAPLTVIDCRNLRERDGAALLFGTECFSENSASPESRRFTDSPDYREAFGALHLSHGGALLLRHIEELSLPAQRILERYLRLQESALRDSDFPFFPRTRIIATSGLELQALVAEQRFLPELARRLDDRTLRIPSLGERQKDILRLANHFLAQVSHEKRFTRDAGAVLFSRKYRHKNVSELKDIVQIAATLSKGREITEDHIPAAHQEERALLEIDLAKVPVFVPLLKKEFIGTLRALIAAVFAVSLLLSLLPTLVPQGAILARFSNALVWGVWEPLLILSFLLVGRLWCTLCPMSLIGNLAKRLPFLHLHRPHPDWFARASVPVCIAGFVGITLVEHYFDMPASPGATAMLFIGMISAAVILSLIYQRQAFCRYFCPLGTLGAALSPSGVLQLRADPYVCTTRCTTHDCYKGNDKYRGCPVFHHPLQMSESDECKLCLNCLRSCPHSSTKLFFRPAYTGIWSAPQLNKRLAPFGFSLFWYSALLMTFSNELWRVPPAGPWLLLASALISTLAGWGMYAFFENRFQNESREDPSVVTRISTGLLVLALGPLMAFQFEHIPLFTQLRVEPVPGTFLASLLQGTHLSFVGLLQLGAMAFAVGVCATTFITIRRKLKKLGVVTSRGSWAMLSLITLFYFVHVVTYLITRLRD